MFKTLDAVVGVAYHLVSGLADGISPVFGGAATAAAIVLATVAVRLLVLPLRLWQLRAERARARLAPQVDELRRRHAGDAATLSRELTALYRAERVSPFAGLLPALAQAPFFLVLYRMFASLATAGAVFGVPLGARWLTGGLFGPHTVAFAALAA